MMFFLPVIFIVLIYFLLKDDHITIKGVHSGRAIDLLDERLSKGEISIEEYRKIKSELT
ncbi:MAG: SHOCT domain-containing protein [Candidatus Izemoplasmataceae bacterium]